MRLFRSLSANEIKLEPYEFKRELVMAAYLAENPSVLSVEGDDEPEIIIDELSILDGRTSKLTDGRIDLIVYFQERDELGIIEIKKGEINMSNIKQLEDYLLKKETILNNLPKAKDDDYNGSKWVGILVGTSISSDLIEFINKEKHIVEDTPLKALTIERFINKDNGQVYALTNLYEKKSSKDHTKYIFNGKSYSKGRLVWTIIKHFVDNNQQISFAELSEVFPKKLQGSHGVFTTFEEALKVNSKGYTRYFAKPQEIIMLPSDKVQIAITNQWKIDFFDNILKKFDELGFKITKS